MRPFVLMLCCLLLRCEAPGPAVPAETALMRTTRAAADPADRRVAVLLHGYGSNDEDLLGMAEPLGLGGEIVSLRAPHPAGRGYAWFPIDWTGEGVRYAPEAADAPLERIAAELRSIRARSDRPVVVVGFSQGAMLAMMLAVEHPDTIEAAVALSGALPRELRPAAEPAPIFAAHGASDDVIPIERAREAQAWLRVAGATPVFVEQPGIAHRASPTALARAREWLGEVCSVDCRR